MRMGKSQIRLLYTDADKHQMEAICKIIDCGEQIVGISKLKDLIKTVKCLDVSMDFLENNRATFVGKERLIWKLREEIVSPVIDIVASQNLYKDISLISVLYKFVKDHPKMSNYKEIKGKVLQKMINYYSEKGDKVEEGYYLTKLNDLFGIREEVYREIDEDEKHDGHEYEEDCGDETWVDRTQDKVECGCHIL